uniref:Uncharacterized protein n=1 Tax=Caenorhabditis japonica TaxID=281687 RepID=A0A8R1IND0_CAEJA
MQIKKKSSSQHRRKYVREEVRSHVQRNCSPCGRCNESVLQKGTRRSPGRHNCSEPIQRGSRAQRSTPIYVITQSDSLRAAATDANKKGTTRSSSPNRRVTRAMSVSQHPRINVFAMKCAATIQISPEPTRKIFTYLCATSRTTSLQGPRQAHQRVGRYKVTKTSRTHVATTKNVLNG